MTGLEADTASRVRAQPSSAQTDRAALLFDDTVLHEIRLRTPAGAWKGLIDHYGDNDFIHGDLGWRGRVVKDVGIRSRGSGSRNPHKPGLEIEFGHFAHSQTFLGLSSLVLDNLYTDSAMLRERISMKFIAKLGLPAPRESSVKLFVDDEYIGLYAIVEPIDKRFLARVPGLDADGFLFEYRWREKWLFTELSAEVPGYRERFAARTRQRTPDPELYGPLMAFVKVFADPPGALADVHRYLNARLFLRQLAAEAYLADWDGLVGAFGLNNFYLYKRPDNDEFRFLPWDKDNTFRASDYPVWAEDMEENALTRRLMADRGLREYFLQSVIECADLADARDPGTSGAAGLPWLQRELESQYAQIADAAHLDGRKPQGNRLFEDAVSVLRAFARTRSAFVRAAVAEKQREPLMAARR